MKLHEKCKKAGLKSLAELIRITGESKQTLIDWHNSDNPKFKRRLDFIILAAAITKQEQSK